MAKFVIRPEINYHKEGDYELLHAALKKRGMYRALRLTDTITKKVDWYDLPTGTYIADLNLSVEQVKNLASDGLQEIGKTNTDRARDYELSVFLWTDALCDLKINTDTSKRP